MELQYLGGHGQEEKGLFPTKCHLEEGEKSISG